MLSFDHNIIFAEEIQKGWGGFRFRRTFYAKSLDLWNSLKLRCEEIETGICADMVKMLTDGGNL